ncbi:hypothetical protein R6Q59_023902 [Mikania micrantha]
MESSLLARKVVEVSTSRTGKHKHAKCHLVGINIFNVKKLQDIIPSFHNYDVLNLSHTDHNILVSLLTKTHGTKDDLRLPIDYTLLTFTKTTGPSQGDA